MLIFMVLVVVKKYFFTNNDSAYESALLFKKGIKVEAIIDIRENSDLKIVKEVKD